MKLTLEMAEKIIDAGLRKASELGIKVTFALVDESGNLVALKRMDGALSLTVRIAENMAYSAAVWKTPGEKMVSWYNAPWFHSQVIQSGGRLLPSEGAMLIQSEEEILGATGVSGGTGKEDKLCAEAGLKALARS